MSAGDLGAVIAAVLSLGAVVVLTVLTLQLRRTLDDLGTAVARLHDESVPLLAEARETVSRAGAEADRVDDLLDSAEAVAARVDGASRVAYLALSKPVIKTAAVATGAQRAARRLRRGPG